MADMAAEDDIIAAAEEAAGRSSAAAPAPISQLVKALRNGVDPLNLVSETAVSLDPDVEAQAVNPQNAPEHAGMAEGSVEDDVTDAASDVAQLVTQPAILIEAPALAPYNPFKPKAGGTRTTVPKVHHKLHKLIHKAAIAAVPAAAPLINDAAAVADELAPAFDDPIEEARLGLSGAPFSGAAAPVYDPAKLQKRLAKLARTAVTTALPAEGPVMDDAEALQKDIADDFASDVQQATSGVLGPAPSPARHAAAGPTFPKPKIHKKIHKLVHKAIVAAVPDLAPVADAGEALADMLAPAIDEPAAAALRTSLAAPSPATFPKPKVHKKIHKFINRVVPAAAPALDAAAQATDSWTPMLDEPLDAAVGMIAGGLAPAAGPLDGMRKMAKDLRQAVASAVPAAAPMMAAMGDLVGDELQDVPADAPGLDALPADIATALGKLTPNARVPALETAISALGETSRPNQTTSAVQRAYMDALIKEAREYERAYQSAREAIVRTSFPADPSPECRPLLSVTS